MEGPSIVILTEELQEFIGQKVLSVSGNSKEPKEELKGRILDQVDAWGKVLFLTFAHKTKAPIVTKTHFMMFGSYRINDPKENRIPRIELTFKNGVVYFYSCSFKLFADEYLKSVDRRIDVLAPEWDEEYILKLMEKKSDTYLCDLFLDQTLFAGAGNIVKNEALFNIRRHPLTKLKDIPREDWPKLVHDIHDYCYNFYEWKKEFQLRKHWQVYKKRKCPVCDSKIQREKMGKGERSTFFCPKCQSERLRFTQLILYDVLPIEETSVKEKRLDH